MERNITVKRKIILTVATVAAVSCSAAAELPELYFDPPARIIEVSKETTTLIANRNSDLEIVVPSGSGDILPYAGSELQKFIEKATGAKVPLTDKRSSAKYAVILGDNPLFRKAYPDLDPAKFWLDGFCILKRGNEIYIVGRDSKGKKLQKFLKTRSGDFRNECYFERATLFGVYEFLERFVGVRFFFSGEIGTVVPHLSELKIPASIRIMERPDFTCRKTSWWWNVPQTAEDLHYNKTMDVLTESNRTYLRWRMETRRIPNCHGLAWLGYPYRFGKTHPEFFAMRKNGKREPGTIGADYSGQLCLTSKGLRDEIFKDVRSWLLGEKPTVRGINPFGKGFYWAAPAFQPGFANIMPQDGFFKCRCPECRKYFDKGAISASNLIWEMTADIANRVKAADLPGYVTQMAYHFYNTIPDVEVPDNVLVMLAVQGPWREGTPAQGPQDRQIKAWFEKAKRKIAFWHYPHHNIRGIPHTTMRSIANHYQRHKDLYYGGNLQNGSPNSRLWDVPNAYIASKIFWNAGQDIDALLDDFCAKLFGKGAGEMKKFFDAVERKWIENRKEIDTDLGPETVPLSQYTIWTKIYPPAELKRLDAYFAKAEEQTKNDPDSLKRVKFFRRQYIGKMMEYARAFEQDQKDSQEIMLHAGKRKAPVSLDADFRIPGETAYLRSIKTPKTDLPIYAVAHKDAEALYITFRCDEPEMDRLKITDPKIRKKLHEDTVFEIFLNPSGDNQNYYQIVVHPSGEWQGLAFPGGKPWKPDIKVRCLIGKDFWSAEAAIPLKALGEMKDEFPFNLSYNRQLKDEPMYKRLYSWSPFLKNNFHSIDRYGRLSMKKGEDKNLVKNGNFDAELKNDRIGAWIVKYPSDPAFSGAIEPDPFEFITGGQSLYLRMDAGKSVFAVQNLRLKPDTEYAFTYWIKHDIPMTSVVWISVFAGRNFFMPKESIRGKADWHKKRFSFRTPKNFNGRAAVSFAIRKPKAELWVDNIRIEEISK